MLSSERLAICFLTHRLDCASSFRLVLSWMHSINLSEHILPSFAYLKVHVGLEGGAVWEANLLLPLLDKTLTGSRLFVLARPMEQPSWKLEAGQIRHAVKLAR